jgi:hypothetical protein
MSRKPLYGMTEVQENRFWRISDHLRSFGYFVSSEPIEHTEECIDVWLDQLEECLPAIEAKLVDIQKAYRVRGKSKRARYILTTHLFFDPGFGIALNHDQREVNVAYDKQRARIRKSWESAA